MQFVPRAKRLGNKSHTKGEGLYWPGRPLEGLADASNKSKGDRQTAPLVKPLLDYRFLPASDHNGMPVVAALWASKLEAMGQQLGQLPLQGSKKANSK